MVPVTSTFWPGDEVVGGDLGADRRSASSSLTRNSATLRFGSTLAMAKWPRSALVMFFALRGAGAELQGDVAVLLLGALGDHLAVVELQHGHRHVRAGFGEDAGHPELLAITPERMA